MGSSNHKEIDELYKQLAFVLKKTKMSKGQLSKGINMSYPGFLNSLNNRKLSLEKWVEISKFINLPITLQLETGKKPAQAEPEDVIVEVKEKNQGADKDKLALLQKQIEILESRLADKDLIISLLK
ncbi:MAG: hypothetical protein EP332_04600 [Bacteroidetes bacterium]|nr:MAG: hypothetical protein EP332_04600 [Bacteroidota bacterium]